MLIIMIADDDVDDDDDDAVVRTQMFDYATILFVCLQASESLDL